MSFWDAIGKSISRVARYIPKEYNRVKKEIILELGTKSNQQIRYALVTTKPNSRGYIYLEQEARRRGL